MATSFMDNIRRPKSLGRWAPTGEILAGESDPYAWGKDLVERGYRNSQVDEMPGLRRGNISRMGSSVANPNFNRAGFDPAKAYQNTVYNQAPEMATKQLNLQKDKMAAAEKENEKQRVVDMMAANDDFIDKRRATELKQKQVETQDWAARNLKPGELGDKDKMQIDFENRKALQDANNAAESGRLTQSLDAKQRAEIEQSINDWVKYNSTNRVNTENNQRTTAAQTEAARMRSEATERAARIRAAGTEEERQQILNEQPRLMGAGNSAGLGVNVAELGVPINKEAPIRPDLKDNNVGLDGRGAANATPAPPPGMKPGGKWIMTRSGKQIYQEP